MTDSLPTDPTPSPTPRKFTQLEELDMARREITRMRAVAEDAHRKYMAAELERRELESALDYMQASAAKGLAVIEAAQRWKAARDGHLHWKLAKAQELITAIDAWEASDD